MAQFINSDQNISAGIYFVDCANNNVTLTIPANTYDYEAFIINRLDNSTNVLTIIVTNNLSSGEPDFELQGFDNIQILGINGIWYPYSGSTRQIRI